MNFGPDLVGLRAIFHSSGELSVQAVTALMLTIEPGPLDARSSWMEFESLAVETSREVGLRALEETLADAQERLIDSVCGPR